MTQRSARVQHIFACGLTILVLGIVLLCTSGTALADGVWLPDNFSTLGVEIDRLWTIIFWLTVVMFFLTEGALVWFLFRYRQRPGRKAQYFHDHKGLEAARAARLTGVKWQRCQCHLQRNAMKYIPRVAMRRSVAQAIRKAMDCGLV